MAVGAAKQALSARPRRTTSRSRRQRPPRQQPLQLRASTHRDTEQCCTMRHRRHIHMGRRLRPRDRGTVVTRTGTGGLSTPRRHLHHCSPTIPLRLGTRRLRCTHRLRPRGMDRRRRDMGTGTTAMGTATDTPT